jgi:hypothetical protein
MRVPTSWASAVDPSWCWDWGTNSGYIVPTTTQSVPATRNTTTVRPWPAIVRVVPRLLPYSTLLPPCRAVAWGPLQAGQVLEDSHLGSTDSPVCIIRTDFGENAHLATGLEHGARHTGHGAWMGPGVESPQGPGYDRRRKQDPETTRVWQACGTDCRLRQLQQATDGTGHRPNVSSDGTSACWETGRKGDGTKSHWTHQGCNFPVPTAALGPFP